MVACNQSLAIQSLLLAYSPGTHMTYTYNMYANTHTHTQSTEGSHYHRSIAENKTMRARAVAIRGFAGPS